MKCKKCGYKTTTINGMRKHYMKAHPGAMKHHGPRKRRYHGDGETRDTPGMYIVYRGKRLEIPLREL